MTDTDPDIPNRGYKQRIIRCKDEPGSEIPCNSDRADFRAPDNITTTTPTGPTTTTTTTTTTTPMSGNYLSINYFFKYATYSYTYQHTSHKKTQEQRSVFKNKIMSSETFFVFS